MSAPSLVITPELFGRSLREPAAHQVLRAWREGRIAPSMNRPLLKRYLRVLKGLGVVEEPLLRAWIWTWTENTDVQWGIGGVDPATEGAGTGWGICQDLARSLGVPLLSSHGAAHEGEGEREGVIHLPLSAFLDWLGGSPEKT